MSYHIMAYSIASAGGVTNQDIPAVSDGFATIQNNHFILQKNWMLEWAAAFGANVLNAKIVTPYLRTISAPSIQPVDTAATPTSLPAIADFHNAQVQLKAIDETAFQATDAAVAGNIHGILGIRDTLLSGIPAGPVTVIRGTAAATPVARTWGTGAITFEDILQAGRYAVIGMHVQGANLVAARLVFPDSGARPGVIAVTAVSNKPDDMFLSGRFGNWGEFENTAPPLLDCFGNTAPTTQTVWLKVVKVR